MAGTPGSARAKRRGKTPSAPILGFCRPKDWPRIRKKACVRLIQSPGPLVRAPAARPKVCPHPPRCGILRDPPVGAGRARRKHARPGPPARIGETVAAPRPRPILRPILPILPNRPMRLNRLNRLNRPIPFNPLFPPFLPQPPPPTHRIRSWKSTASYAASSKYDLRRG